MKKKAGGSLLTGKMATDVCSVSDAYDECTEAHDKAYVSISTEFKKKIKLAEARIEKAEAEYHQIKKMAEKSMDPGLKQKYFQARKKLEKVWLGKTRGLKQT